MNKTIHILAGGTVFHVRPHLALAAPAYGGTGHHLLSLCQELAPKLEPHLHLTKMAGGKQLETNQDVSGLLDELVADTNVKIIFMPVALCDYEGSILDTFYVDNLYQATATPSGKDQPRLKTSDSNREWMKMRPAEKVISKIRRTRKDIFLVGFKTTSGATEQEQFLAGLGLCKGASCNLVLANDLRTKVNMVITPEEAAYHVTTDRQEALRGLVEMAVLRSHLTFTRSTIVAGDPVPWNSELVPTALRTVVDFCIQEGAYKPFRGATVGHFAAKLNDTTFLTSRRKTNFNELSKLGLVKVQTDGPDSVIAFGSKPSVGGQSQRIVFTEHPDCNCIVHFHCPIKSGSLVPAVSQREFECGSHECGQNTSRGLQKFGNLYAVYLKQHGPNIVFNHNIDPVEVINFIQANFDLSQKTGGYTI
jgi:hypothetical protein